MKSPKVADFRASNISLNASTAFSVSMNRQILTAVSAAQWAQLNNVELNGIEISKLPGSKGFGIVAKHDIADENPILMTVPKDLILSLENVWLYAKSDRHLQEVLNAVGDFARVWRLPL